MTEILMRRLTVCACVAWAPLAGTAAAQTKIVTLEDYAKVMKSNAQTGGGMQKALAAQAYPEARTLLATVRRNFVALDSFWAARKRPDAVAIVKEGLSRIDAMDTLLASNADIETVRTASMEFGRSTCGACHKLYREGDDQAGFRFVPGVFEPSTMPRR